MARALPLTNLARYPKPSARSRASASAPAGAQKSVSGYRRGHGKVTEAATGWCWTCECREGWEGMEGPGIEAAEAAAEGLAEALDHGSDAGNVVVGGADEGEEALDGVLSQHPHPCRQDVVRGRRAGAVAIPCSSVGPPHLGSPWQPCGTGGQPPPRHGTGPTAPHPAGSSHAGSGPSLWCPASLLWRGTRPAPPHAHPPRRTPCTRADPRPAVGSRLGPPAHPSRPPGCSPTTCRTRGGRGRLGRASRAGGHPRPPGWLTGSSVPRKAPGPGAARPVGTAGSATETDKRPGRPAASWGSGEQLRAPARGVKAAPGAAPRLPHSPGPAPHLPTTPQPVLPALHLLPSPGTSRHRETRAGGAPAAVRPSSARGRKRGRRRRTCPPRSRSRSLPARSGRGSAAEVYFLRINRFFFFLQNKYKQRPSAGPARGWAQGWGAARGAGREGPPWGAAAARTASQGAAGWGSGHREREGGGTGDRPHPSRFPWPPVSAGQLHGVGVTEPRLP